MKDSDWAFLRQLYMTPNITKAANALFISQPALTKRLQYIEDEWGVQIVHRNKNGLDFTSEGLYLAKQALKYMDFLEETKCQLDMLRSNHKANLTIGTSLSYLSLVLPHLIAEFTAAHPEIRFDVLGGRSSEVLHMVEQGNVQLGILRGRTSDLVEKMQINEEKCYVISSVPLDSLDALAWTPRVDYPLNDLTRQLVDNWWNQRFRTPPIIGMTVEHMDQTFPMISQSLGYAIAFLPEKKEIKALKGLYLTPITIKDSDVPLTRPTWLIWQAKKPLTPEVNSFLQFMREQAGK